jgi:hypothetical protein
MGDGTHEMYLQGFSSSMPSYIQAQMLHSIKGFENAVVMRHAYAIEYDCIDSTQLSAALMFKEIPGLFGAGQFNGTSGYEEAAAQGLIAGMNAALFVQEKAPVTLTRNSSYIGTLIDDLVTKGTNEPYRMMTSRSEFRLILRQDNADDRLSEIGYAAGLLPEEKILRFREKKAQIEAEKSRLRSVIISPKDGIIRKGAVSAHLGEELIIPMNMADGILLCRGKGNEDWNCSAPHGAGRLFSRTAAKEQLSMDEFRERMSDVYSTSVCESTLDESPMAYKPTEEIRSLIEPTVEVLDVIKPVINLKAK